MKYRMLKFLIVFGALLLVSACGRSNHTRYVSQDTLSLNGRTAAVLPLVNLTSHPDAGQAVSDILATELYSVKGISYLESTSLLEQLKAGESDLAYVMDRTVAQEAGRKLGVDTVIYGSVSEYRYRRGLDQAPAVGINLRMLDVPSGEVLWASSISRTGGCFVGCNDSLNAVAQDACADAVQALADAVE